MDLDVCGVDYLERARFLLFHVDRQEFAENAPASPAQVESINAVPFSVSFGKLIPDASGYKNPPDSVPSFSKIGRRSPTF